MSNTTTIRLGLALLLPLGQFSSDAFGQFGGRAGPPSPPHIGGQAPPPVIMSAPVARQSALPLTMPPISPILNRRLPFASTFGGFGYYPYYDYYSEYPQSNVSVNHNYNYFYPERYFPPRTLGSLPNLPNSHPNTARLTLTVPTGAEIFIDGKTVEMSETQRTFESSELKAGESHTFDVRVAWTEKGKQVEEKRTLAVKAGEHQSLHYIALSTSVSGGER
jgi:uncharacterized protein (TIGR03000 family)